MTVLSPDFHSWVLDSFEFEETFPKTLADLKATLEKTLYPDEARDSAYIALTAHTQDNRSLVDYTKIFRALAHTTHV